MRPIARRTRRHQRLDCLQENRDRNVRHSLSTRLLHRIAILTGGFTAHDDMRWVLLVLFAHVYQALAFAITPVATPPVVAPERLCWWCLPGAPEKGCDCKLVESGAWLCGECLAVHAPKVKPCGEAIPVCQRAWQASPPASHWSRSGPTPNWHQIDCADREISCANPNATCISLTETECTAFGFRFKHELYYFPGCCILRGIADRLFCTCPNALNENATIDFVPTPTPLYSERTRLAN